LAYKIAGERAGERKLQRGGDAPGRPQYVSENRVPSLPLSFDDPDREVSLTQASLRSKL
jgi:hypothetical protein